jgi:(R,R)-butanediol dehydrogenase/meso-butanediol dehydrogenase/diacetyl reductase
MAMKAAVFEGLGKPLAIREVAEPELAPGEVLLKVENCGICGSDLHATEDGVFLQAEGTVLGHEFAGIVAASADPAVPEGLRATAVPVNACEACRDLGTCKDGLGILCPNNRITGLALDVPGAYADYVKVGARQVVPLPEGVSFEQGAMVEPLAVGLHAVEKAQIPMGGRVLVIGAGPIGLSVTAFARLAGAARIVVSERAEARRAAASDFGATDVLDPGAVEDVGAAFSAATGGPPDVIFDCVGVPGMIQSCIDLSRPKGTIVVVGVCMKPDEVIPIAAILKELKLQFVLGYVESDFARVLDYLGQGRIEADGMVTDRVTLDQLPDAFEALRRPDRQIKVMIRPGG